MDSIDRGVSKSRTRLSSLHFHCFGRKNMVCKPCLALSLNPSLSVNGDSFVFICQLLAHFLISLPLPSHQNTLLALPPWWCPESDHFSHPNPGHFHFLSWLVQEPLASLKLYFNTGIKVKSAVKNLPANARDMGSIPGLGRSLEKEMAVHSSILAWEIRWTEDPGRLQSIGSQRVRHNWSDLACTVCTRLLN